MATDVSAHPFVPLAGYREYPEDEMAARAREFHAELARRRTVRDFSSRPVPRAVIDDCLRAATTAPSGANLQPWHFVVVWRPGDEAADPRGGRKRRSATSTGTGRPREWLDALAPLGTDERKPFLETAPWLIAIFAQKYGRLDDGRKVKHYYPTESVGLATGMLITALHHAGLATLTHTPSPMKFLNEILGRPKAAERPFLLLVVGYPAADATVPDIGRKPLAEVVTYV